MSERDGRNPGIQSRGAVSMPPGIRAGAGALGDVEINKVLRNTYLLLGLTLAWSAVMATLAVMLNMPPLGPIITLVGFFGLLFAVNKTANSGLGIVMVFALTGFMGFTLGPIVSLYLNLAHGHTLVASALGCTALAFVGLSGYALVTRKDFSFLQGFLVVGFFVLMGVVIASLVFDLSAFHGAISAAFVLFASATILWQTSAIIHGGETNYLQATVTLYVSIYNLFLSLLQLFGIASED
jgi:modulator of FtsH protease